MRIRWQDLPEPPPWNEQDPTVPLYGYFPDAPEEWMARHDRFNEISQEGAARIVFIGDSITQDWAGAGKPLWDRLYAPLGAVNFGIGGDRTQQLLWRIAHGNLEGLSPELVVLKIGVNNLWSGDASTERVAEGRARCVAAIREKCPMAKVLLLGILPTIADPDHPIRAQIKAINALSIPLDNGVTVRYLDMGDHFVSGEGAISPAIMPDYCHLSETGYGIWATAMAPLLAEMLTV